MDLVDRGHHRAARWVGTKGTIAWDAAGAVRLIDGGNADDILWHDGAFDLDRTYQAELDEFLAGRPFPGDARADAVRVLEIVAALRGD
jgi:hypothetical protein